MGHIYMTRKTPAVGMSLVLLRLRGGAKAGILYRIPALNARSSSSSVRLIRHCTEAAHRWLPDYVYKGPRQLPCATNGACVSYDL